MVSANTKNEIDDKTGMYLLTKALKLVLLSNYYPFLPSTQGRTATNWWNLRKIGGAIAWRDKNLLVVEIFGVLGRLHSNQGLAQSNNNAMLNYSAKRHNKAAGNKVPR
jgi:hypothetical protein